MPRTVGARNLTAEQRSEIVALASAGWPYPEIADQLGLNRSTVAKIARRAHGYRCEAKARRPLLGTTDARR